MKTSQRWILQRRLSLREERQGFAAAGWLLTTSLCSCALAQATLRLVFIYALAALVRQGDTRGVTLAIGELCLVLALQRGVELVTASLTQLVRAHIDVAVRQRALRAVYRPSGMAPFETSDMRGTLTLLGTSMQGHTLGSSVPARISLLGNTVAGIGCFLIIFDVSWWAAVLLLSLALTRRWTQQRVFGLVQRPWHGDASAGQQLEFWRRFQMELPSARESRVFGLTAWSVDQFHQAWIRRYSPLWEGRKRAFHASWGPAGLGFLAATLALTGAIAAGPTTSQIASVLAAGLTLLQLTVPAGENLALEHARPLGAGLHRVEAASDAQLTREVISRSPRTFAPGEPRGVDSGQPALLFNAVSFAYPESGRNALADVSLAVQVGHTVAIVGANGAGKSTMMKLICGLYTPTTGTISVLGCPLQTYEMTRWRERLAIMPQGAPHLDLSLREQVMLGAYEHFGDGDFFERHAGGLGITDLADSLPRGWDTPLGTGRPGGVDLSGGQWQRVELARVMMSVRAGRRIVILDEPTAHLDAETELTALERLREIGADSTLILVSHRMATVRHADHIIVLEAGRVVESGSHRDLCKSQGLYNAMFHAQADRYASAANGVEGQTA